MIDGFLPRSTRFLIRSRELRDAANLARILHVYRKTRRGIYIYGVVDKSKCFVALNSTFICSPCETLIATVCDSRKVLIFAETHDPGRRVTIDRRCVSVYTPVDRPVYFARSTRVSLISLLYCVATQTRSRRTIRSAGSNGPFVDNGAGQWGIDRFPILYFLSKD